MARWHMHALGSRKVDIGRDMSRHPRSLPRSDMRHLGRSGVCLAMLVLLSADLAQAQAPAPRPGSDRSTQPDRNVPTIATPSTPADTSTPEQQRPRLDLRLSAALTNGSPRIDQGLVWRIFLLPDPSGSDTPPAPKLLETRREAMPLLKLPPGEYIVSVAYGRANLTRRVRVAAGGSPEEVFVLNAGGLRVRAALASGEPAPDSSVAYDVYMAEPDQFGNRPKIVANARPGLIVRLNSGAYHIVSVWGDANAIVRADISIEAGKLMEAKVSHYGAKVTFKLVERSGGEALADTRWSVKTVQGETVVESTGALPTHILATGTYIVSARHSGRTFNSEFALEAGEPVQVEVVMQ